jgi:hypothetical protein
MTPEDFSRPPERPQIPEAAARAELSELLAAALVEDLERFLTLPTKDDKERNGVAHPSVRRRLREARAGVTSEWVSAWQEEPRTPPSPAEVWTAAAPRQPPPKLRRR